MHTPIGGGLLQDKDRVLATQSDYYSTLLVLQLDARSVR